MGKGYRKMIRRAKKVVGKAHRGPCFKKGCQLNGGILHECLTCENLAKAAEMAGEDHGIVVFKIQCCTRHSDEGLKKVRRHALTAHPANLLRVVAAGLKGEQI